LATDRWHDNHKRPLTFVRGLSFFPLSNRGFTLVELALVVAITMLMAMLAISAYRTYKVRNQVATGIAVSIPAQDRVIEAFRRWGTPPANAKAAGVSKGPTGTLFVETLDVVNGRIDVRFSAAAYDAIAGKTLSLTPFETADQEVVWLCGSELPGVGLNPLGFASGSPQAVQVPTGIEARYLPSSCR
jgi:type IV pilus assembly protein PilA